LTELGSHRFRIRYRGDPREAILVRFRGVAYGYLNQCVHMPKELDCEQCHIFDAAGASIRCSMHGITYDPRTGACLSEICAGRSLTPLRVQEREGTLYLTEKRTTLLTTGQ
jgi:nitrite reductase/ring-hydroxylating ferredoxin subunit